MADITRRTAKILLDQMLTKYCQIIEVCRDNKTKLSAEALAIVNDYESNGIGKIIDKILHTEDYFSNYDAESYFKFFDNTRALLSALDLEVSRDVALVDSIIDKEEIRLVCEKEKSLVNSNGKVKFQILKADENGGEERLSRLRYNVQWSVEKIKEDESETGTEDALAKRKAIFDQKDRSITFNESGRYKITSYIYIKDLWGRKELADVLTYEQEVVGENKILPETWKIYLDKNNQIKEVKYGPDKTKAQVISSDGKVGAVISMAGSDYENKGFAKKLLTAAGITATDKADFELQEKMLDSGLVYLNDEQAKVLHKDKAWIKKQDYYDLMTPKEFLKLKDYKDVTVKAVYEDAKGELSFTYIINRKTKSLFVIKASNNQKKRNYPTEDGSLMASPMYTMPNTRGKIKTPYKPGKFPTGHWIIESFEKSYTEGYGPYKIRTNATRNVVGYQQKYDENNILIGWKEIKNEMGENIPFEDGHLLIHGGTGRRIDKLNTIEKLDAREGDNDYLGTTHGCIRISNLDVYLIVETLKKYLEFKGQIELEVK